MAKECCKNCKYIRKLEHNFVPEYGHERSYCCVLFEYMKEPERFIQPEINTIIEIGDIKEARCEMFSEK